MFDASRGFAFSLTEQRNRGISERLGTEVFYQTTLTQSNANRNKRNLKWILVYVIYASILWLMIAMAFFIPNKPSKYYNQPNTVTCNSAVRWFPVWTYIGIGISIFNIGLLWFYLVIYKSINIGILFLFFNIVNGEVAYYCMVRRYSYQINPNGCLEGAVYINNTIWDFGLYSIWFHVILQWSFSCCRSCCNKCTIGQNLYRFWGKITVILTYICMIWIICVYIYISYHLAIGLTAETEHGWGIITVIFCLICVTLGMFPFPFCTELSIQLVDGWNCAICRFICVCCECCNKNYSVKYYKPYSETVGVDEEKRTKLLPINEIKTDADCQRIFSNHDEESYKL